jgi:hypothetical protein
MPTYQNSTRSTVIVKNTDGVDIPVKPGESIETFEQVAGFTQTAETPANEITIDADPGEDVFTSGIKPNPQGYLNISISGGGSAVTLQRSLDGGVSWKDLWDTSLTGNVSEESIQDFSKNVLYRLGVKNGRYLEGSTTFRLSW